MKLRVAGGWSLEAAARFSWVALALLLTIAETSFAQMKPGDVRKAYGEARASVMESLLTTVYPGAEVVWDPHDVTAQAQWTILDFGSEVDFSVVNGVPHVFSRKYGMVQLYGTLGGKSAMTRIYILPPDELRSNKMGRKGAPMNRDAPLQIIIADPHVGRIP
jgi:hypothetical protein